MESKKKTYLDVLRESAMIYNSFTNSDIEFIEQLLSLSGDDLKNKNNPDFKRHINWLTRKLPEGLESISERYIDLKKKELDLFYREKKIAIRERELGLNSAEMTTLPEVFF